MLVKKSDWLDFDDFCMQCLKKVQMWITMSLKMLPYIYLDQNRNKPCLFSMAYLFTLHDVSIGESAKQSKCLIENKNI